MTDAANAAALRRLLVGQYDELKKQLARRLGSEDLAGEVLQETYLRLERPVRFGVIRSPKHYLLTIATNIARMRFRKERRWVDMAELDAALGFVDETPDPLRRLEGQQEIAALLEAFSELTPRRQHILVASRLEGKSLGEIATELNLSERTVLKELKTALLHSGQRLKRDVVQRFGPRASKASSLIKDATEVTPQAMHDDQTE